MLAGLFVALATGARAESMVILGQSIAPGETRRLALPVGESVGGEVSTPVIVVAGERPGPVVCLTGGIHGDELNGVEVVRRSVEGAKPAELRGTLVGVPIVNLAAFRRGSRYLPDRRDLNRFFPGSARGSSAARLARRLFDEVVRRCNAVVDVHSGSFHRTNLPQVRGDLRKPEVLRLAKTFGSQLAIHNEGRAGTLRRAATDAGIPAIAYEAGEPMRCLHQVLKSRIVKGSNPKGAIPSPFLDRPPLRHTREQVERNAGSSDRCPRCAAPPAFQE